MTPNVKKMYDEVPEFVKEDIVKASMWALDKLLRKEGEGHIIQVLGDQDRQVVCEFSKPEWAASHVGAPMETGSEAIVLATCEYLCGE